MKRIKNGFTLVELLIVIALIAILSVAVLATINPIEQSNKAKDSTVQNDAAEVLNAYERYYAAQSSYPWVDIFKTNSVTVDTAINLNSFDVGAGLCTKTSAAISDALTPCDSDPSTHQGLLISTTELKDSFLSKGYAGVSTTNPTYADMLYVVKTGVATGNSIYVCYIPKAKANRSVNSKLYDLQLDGSNRAAAFINTSDAAVAATYFSNGKLTAAYDFTDQASSLFKCVP